MSVDTARRAQELVRELDHPRPEERKAAADALLALGPDAEPALTTALRQTHDIKVRRRILIVLRDLKAPKAIPALLDYVLDLPADGADDTRSLALRAAVDAVQPRHARHVFDTFVQLRRDPEPLIRVIALEGLARLGDPRALRFLEEAARSTDADEAVRDTAARLLVTFVESDPAERGAEPVYSRVDLLQKLASRDAFQREAAVDELIARNLEPFDAFLDALRSSHDLARQSGILGLGRLKDPRGFTVLWRLVDHENTSDNDRALALRALGELDLPGDLDATVHLRNLERFLRSNDIFVVAGALKAIARVPHPDALEVVSRRLESPQPWLRDAAAEALAANAAQHNTELLEPLARGLVDSARRSLERRATSGDWPADEANFQQALLTALNRIARRGGGPERGVAATVARYLAHPRAEIRQAAVTFLDTVAQHPGDLADSALEALLELLESKRHGAAAAALDVLERTLPARSHAAARPLVRLTFHNETDLVRRAIALLGRCCSDSSEAEQALARLAADPRPDIAEAARAALLRDPRGTLQ